ncbi:hypothetical protein [Rhodovulum sp. FJ3]|uniref:hypothetical protein n=1 Tax=Rhodovulum sp. FJ3 TaxID=3079053 RepID=UPI00293DC536|nr:hypothetical protein [Rhodovulum sp. FJ3]MDV4167921.1 hypothetical protein [Rhodovulum sp. FJ3]
MYDDTAANLGALWITASILICFPSYFISLIFLRGATRSITRITWFVCLNAVPLLGAVALAPFFLTEIKPWSEQSWLFIAYFLCVNVAVGYGLAVFAHARSVNARENGRLAWMAMIPPLNLILFFHPPREGHPLTPVGRLIKLLWFLFGIFLWMCMRALLDLYALN